jgi:hypothetical protein
MDLIITASQAKNNQKDPLTPIRHRAFLSGMHVPAPGTLYPHDQPPQSGPL